MTELLKDIDENMLISSQKGILEYFKKYKSENYISLSQKDFDYGTRRITKPGYYILKEDIVFHPNPDNDFKPTGTEGELNEINKRELNKENRLYIEILKNRGGRVGLTELLEYSGNKATIKNSIEIEAENPFK